MPRGPLAPVDRLVGWQIGGTGQMSDDAAFDLVIIGGGPAGYTGAIRAGQLGLKVACIEKRATLGGTCLNVGCIPSKALLYASEVYHETKTGLDRLGGKGGDVALDLATMMAHKSKTVSENVRGIEYLFRKHKVEHIRGSARLAGPGAVEVSLSD